MPAPKTKAPAPAPKLPAKQAAVAAVKKPAAKTAVKSAVPKKLVAAPTQAPDVAKTKPKLVRDSFTMPKAEYVVIDALKQRLAKLARPAKKSELLRAGIKALSALNDKALLAALEAVPSLKTGRPNKD